VVGVAFIAVGVEIEQGSGLGQVKANETAGPADGQSHQLVDLGDEAETTWPL
jgi:hypothetical protein